MKDKKFDLKNSSKQELINIILSLRNDNASLQEIINKNNLEITKLEESVKYWKDILFNRKSEKRIYNDDNDSNLIRLFDETDALNAISETEEKIEESKTQLIKGYVRKTKKKLDISTLNLEKKIETVEAIIPTGYKKIKTIGYYEVDKLYKIPASYYIKTTRYERIVASDQDGNELIIKANRNDPLCLRGSFASGEFLASIIKDKFALYLPLYRQEQELHRQNINISRTHLSDLIKKFSIYAAPLYKKIQEYIKHANNVRADETTMNILELNSNKARLTRDDAKSKSYIWCFMTARGYYKAVDYQVGPTRSNDVVYNYFPTLKKTRYLQSDGYEAYNSKLASFKWTNVSCLVHIRRQFVETSKLASKNSEAYKVSETLLSYIKTIYKIDKEINEKYEDDYQKIKEERNISLKPIFVSFFKLCKEYSLKFSNGLKISKALQYALNREETMMNILLDGRLTLDNNDAERDAIKPLVMGRKNWLFANTINGAKVTCMMYSLVESAMFNNLDPYKYILHLINTLTDPNNIEFDYSTLLPWSNSLPEEIKNKS